MTFAPASHHFLKLFYPSLKCESAPTLFSVRTISEYSGMSYMNFDKSWIMNYGSSLRDKEENFDNLRCESSQPTVEYHE